MVKTVKITQELATTTETTSEIAEEETPQETVATTEPQEVREEPKRTTEPQEVREEPQEVRAEPKRKPGRPAGSKSKIQGKPRAKRVAKVVPVVVPTEEEESSGEEFIEVRRHREETHRRLPTEGYDRDSRLMMAMLKQQHQERQTRKSDLWRSWFH